MKIVWAMSYMKSGHAQKWTAHIFRWEQQPENLHSSRFLDWEDFRDAFKVEFTPAHADSLDINHLELTAYFQKSRSLDDYIDEFQDLITEAGYTDLKTIVVKFRSQGRWCRRLACPGEQERGAVFLGLCELLSSFHP